MVTGGANLGRIGVITNRERHPGSFDVVHVKDSTGNSFATRLSNIFVIGKVSSLGIRPGRRDGERPRSNDDFQVLRLMKITPAIPLRSSELHVQPSKTSGSWTVGRTECNETWVVVFSTLLVPVEPVV